MCEFTIEDLELAFNSTEPSFKEFLKDLKDNKILENEKVNNSFDIIFDYHRVEVEDVSVDNKDYPGFLSDAITELANEDNYDTVMGNCDNDVMDDDGVAYIEVYTANGRYYKVELFCNAEWCGDWSVRANLPGDSNVTKIFEIVEYDVLVEKEDYITIQAKKYKEIYNSNN